MLQYFNYHYYHQQKNYYKYNMINNRIDIRYYNNRYSYKRNNRYYYKIYIIKIHTSIIGIIKKIQKLCEILVIKQELKVFK